VSAVTSKEDIETRRVELSPGSTPVQIYSSLIVFSVRNVDGAMKIASGDGTSTECSSRPISTSVLSVLGARLFALVTFQGRPYKATPSLLDTSSLSRQSELFSSRHNVNLDNLTANDYRRIMSPGPLRTNVFTAVPKNLVLQVFLKTQCKRVVQTWG